MRVLFTVFPSTAHFLPVVPLAWALQSAGHEVRVASVPGVPTGVALSDFHESVVAAGLTAVSCGEPELLSVHDGGYPGFRDLLPTMAESDRFVEALGIEAPDRAAWDVYYHFALLTIRNYHPPEPRQDVLALVEHARAWQPDLVVWDPWFPCGAVAARASGAAHARLLMSPDYTGWAHERFARCRAGGGPAPADPLAETMRPLAERYGVEVDDDLLLGGWTIDPFPPGLRLSTGVDPVPVRCVPFTGSGVLPDWLREEPDRPRVALSLGVSTRMFFRGDWGRTARLLDAVGDLDIDVVATLNDNQLADVGGRVPGNVRTVDYVPLGQLLPSCSALIHHGSPATFSAATAHRVPQLVTDTDDPTRIVGTARSDGGVDWDLMCQKQLTAGPVAAFVSAQGAGVRLDHRTQSAPEIGDLVLRVLRDPAFQRGADALHDRWEATPSPVDLVPVLERLTNEHREN